MKTSEEIVKAIIIRMNQLDSINESIMEAANAYTDSDILRVVSENEVRLNELDKLLTFIDGYEDDK